MDPDTLRILQSADDPERYECPVGFDWRREVASVRELLVPLERITGRTFSIADGVQDASFFAELGTYDEFRLSHGGTLRLAVLAIRFSSFGRLFTVWSADSSEAPEGRRLGELSPDTMSNVIEAVAVQGYTYVDAASLQTEYAGVNVHLHGKSWWIRFFDYL